MPQRNKKIDFICVRFWQLMFSHFIANLRHKNIQTHAQLFFNLSCIRPMPIRSHNASNTREIEMISKSKNRNPDSCLLRIFAVSSHLFFCNHFCFFAISYRRRKICVRIKPFTCVKLFRRTTSTVGGHVIIPIL